MSVPSGSTTNTTHWAASATDIHCSHFWRLEVQYQVPARAGSGEGPLSGHILISPHGRGREMISLLSLRVRALIPIMTLMTPLPTQSSTSRYHHTVSGRHQQPIAEGDDFRCLCGGRPRAWLVRDQQGGEERGSGCCKASGGFEQCGGAPHLILPQPGPFGDLNCPALQVPWLATPKT